MLVCKWMIDLNVFKGIKPDRTEGNLCKLIYVLGFSLGFHLGPENCWTFLLYVSEKSKCTCITCTNDEVVLLCCIFCLSFDTVTNV